MHDFVPGHIESRTVQLLSPAQHGDFGCLVAYVRSLRAKLAGKVLPRISRDEAGLHCLEKPTDV